MSNYLDTQFYYLDSSVGCWTTPKGDHKLMSSMNLDNLIGCKKILEKDIKEVKKMMEISKQYKEYYSKMKNKLKELEKEINNRI